MCPSEYAYHGDSVSRSESASANCRRYPPGSNNPEHFIHCNGTQLKLAGSNFGQEPYSSSEYYWWSTGSDGQLLFIFPTRVSLTTIILHCYSDNIRDLSRLILYVAPDNFNIWDVLTSGTPYVEVASVPPDGEPVGRRNVGIDVYFNARKL